MTAVFLRILLSGLGLLAGLIPLQACADRPTLLVTPFPVTGTPEIEGTPRITKMVRLTQALSAPPLTDLLVQGLAAGLGAALDQTVRIERKSGNRGAEGLRIVSRASPDGQTLLFGSATVLEVRDSASAPIALVGYVAEMPMALVVEDRADALIVREWIAKARERPGQISVATLVPGSSSSLVAGALQSAARIDFLPVEHNGAAAALNAVATRNVDIALVPLPAALPYVHGGKLKILAVSSASRHPAVPTVPTLAESATAGFASVGRFGIYAPATTPAKTLRTLSHAIDTVVGEEGWQRFLVARGLSPPAR